MHKGKTNRTRLAVCRSREGRSVHASDTFGVCCRVTWTLTLCRSIGDTQTSGGGATASLGRSIYAASLDSDVENSIN